MSIRLVQIALLAIAKILVCISNILILLVLVHTFYAPAHSAKAFLCAKEKNVVLSWNNIETFIIKHKTINISDAFKTFYY